MRTDLITNILANLRKFFNMEDATEAELDQRMEDEVAAQQASSEPDPEETTAAAPATTESPAQQVEEEASVTVPEEITARLDALQEENERLQAEVKALQEKHLAAAAEYEAKPAEADPRDKYLCSITRQALAR